MAKKKPMTYRDVVDWEFEPDTESAILMDADGNIVDRLYVSELVQQWLDEMKDRVVFGGDPAES